MNGSMISYLRWKKYNNIDNLSNEDFLLNQDFIYKLSNEKVKKDIFKSIIEEVRIN